MKISNLGEFGLIDRLKKSLKSKIIGDDTAPFLIGKKTYIATCDILLEGRHFERYFPPEKIGHKAISVNVSDIAASGGIPKYALVSLLLPDIEINYIDKIYQGINQACKKFKCTVIGGNITASDKIGIDIFMIGETRRFIKRNTGNISDYIFLTGSIGDSKAGLQLLKEQRKNYLDYEKKLIEKHLLPKINLKITNYISNHATSSCDVSDGLSSDLNHLIKNKKIRIDIDSKKIPISKELKIFCEKNKIDPISFALSGGEDYRILFTKNTSKSPYFLIGKINKGLGIYIDGKKILNKSFSHF